MRIPTAPMALTLPPMQTLTSPMTSQLTSETPLLFYTFTQPPPQSPALTAGMAQGLSAGMAQGLTSSMAQGLTSSMTQGLTSNMTQGLTSSMNQGLSSVVNPMVSPGVSPAASQGVGSVSPPSAVVPDIMQLINYGDKDLGLLLSQR